MLSGVIPVIGPAIAGGTLGVILSNAAVGAGVGGLVGAGVPEDEAQFYQGEFESGRTIVTVRPDGRADDAMTVMRRYGAYDMSRRPDMSGRAATMANKPLDVSVRGEDVFVGGPSSGMGTGDADRGTVL